VTIVDEVDASVGVRPVVAGSVGLPWWASLVASVAAGGALLVSFPPYGWWWLGPVGVALLAVAVRGRRVRAGFGLGVVAGLTFFLPLFSWTSLYIDSVPWLLLSVLESLYLGLLGAASAFAGRLVDRWGWSWPVVTGVLWVGQESLRGRTPYGGLPWGRLAFGQDGSPVVRFAAWGGAPLVTFVVAFVGGLVAVVLWRLWQRPGGAGWWGTGGYAVGAAVVMAAGLLVPLTAPSGSRVVVAVVQGNVPRMGLDFNAQRQAVLENHVTATIALAGRVATGERPRPDLVVWPENSSDVDPLLNPDAGARIDAAAAAIGAPILVGAVLRGPGEGEVRNAGILWRPGSGADLDQVYVKRHLVPFGEYMPMRRLARMVSKEVDRVRSDFSPGQVPGVVETGPVVLGDVICFEVAYDGVVRDTVTGGAGVLAVQTNNASFDESEARQQLAMVRLRALEHGRDALMASTVGVSAFVGADGSVHQATGFNTQEVIVRELRTGSGRTLATRVGVWPEVFLTGLAVLSLVGSVVVRRRRSPV
jgi:apolipoprotein N-acyltransferase